MSTYRVPQDVEAEDKLLGPLTLKQFIYAIIVFLGIWLTVILARNTYTLFLIPIPLIPALFFAFMIFLGIKNPAQPAESYLAALVRFYFKPHKRIWNQDGVMETVKITAPAKLQHQYVNNLSRDEVRSRLNRLSNLMDSRGWAAKDVRYQPNIILPTQPDPADDRLIGLSQLPQTQLVEPVDWHDSDDLMDERANPVAQGFDSMLIKQQQAARDDAIAHMQDPNYNPYPNMHQRVITPIDDSAQNQTVLAQTPSAGPVPPPQPPLTAHPAPDPALLNLAQNNDLSVQTLANEAERLKKLESGDEISLH